MCFLPENIPLRHQLDKNMFFALWLLHPLFLCVYLFLKGQMIGHLPVGGGGVPLASVRPPPAAACHCRRSNSAGVGGFRLGCQSTAHSAWLPIALSALLRGMKTVATFSQVLGVFANAPAVRIFQQMSLRESRCGSAPVPLL